MAGGADRLILRAARPEDAAALCAIYAPYVAGSFISFEMEPPDAAEMRRRIEGGGSLYPWLVAEEAGEVLGYAYASAFRPRPAYRFAVETTVYLEARAQGRGVGKALYGPLLRVLADQGFTQAFGAISLPNPASVALHERLGFHRAGIYKEAGYKLAAWHDVGVWQRPLAPAQNPPEEARSLAAVGWPDAYLE